MGVKRSFSLLELVIALSLSLFVGMLIYRTLASGLALWKWHRADRSLGDFVIFFEKMSYDLRNYADFSSADFQGRPDKITFYVHDPGYLLNGGGKINDSKREFNPSLYRVEYVFLAERKEIRRKLYKFGSQEAYRNTLCLSDVDKVNFSFSLLDKTDNRENVYHETSGVTPLGMAVDIEWKDSQGNTNNTKRLFSFLNT
ncbi:MAG: hypothetical protein ABH858_01400 [Candidatus Omnitrophota bacterium]